MKLIRTILLGATLALGGCASQLSSVGTAITTTIVNPVNQTDLYRAKNAYAATLELAVAYRRYCYAKPYAALMADPIAKPLCQNRRTVIRTAQAARVRASAALKAAENFIANNPTLNAASIIAAAWQAVSDFQALVPKVSG